jgi:two-component system, chemotaxis family, chemotaxis protein CheY
MKILVVDDSAAMRKIIGAALAKTSYSKERIVEASNGKEAFDKFVDDQFGLILSDWNMPEMDGLEFVSRVRQVDKRVKIVMITTEGTFGKMEEALDAGLDGYVVKPFTPEALERKINSVLKAGKRG